MAKNSRLLSAKQARAIDIRAKDKFGVSTLLLMENAGRSVAREAMKILGKRKSVAIFCGKGNNGGDGFVAVRHLLTCGIKPDVYLAARFCEIENEARINLDVLLKLKQKIIEVGEGNLYLIKDKISKYDLIIDALLGVGLKGRVRGIYGDLIRIINTAKAYVLSIDIPSGLDATTGKILGCCVRADKTVTFVAKKLGMTIHEGAKNCGKIIVKDLGMPLCINPQK
jgi:NAD(P)H-hydrate epimerase